MPRPIVMPSFGMYTMEGTLVKWLQPTGAHVAEGSPILEIETDKATQEVIAPGDGRLHQVAEEGDLVAEQGLLGYILGDGEEPPAQPEPAEPTRETVGPAPTAATPAARRLAREHGIDLTALAGSGPGGRIVEADVQAALSLPGERLPLSPIRRAIANRLIHSVTEAIPCTLTREVEAEALALAREPAQRAPRQLRSFRRLLREAPRRRAARAPGTQCHPRRGLAGAARARPHRNRGGDGRGPGRAGRQGSGPRVARRRCERDQGPRRTGPGRHSAARRSGGRLEHGHQPRGPRHRRLHADSEPTADDDPRNRPPPAGNHASAKARSSPSAPSCSA